MATPLVQVQIDAVNGTDVMSAAFRTAVEGKRYIEFRYTNQKRYKMTPSRAAAIADTNFIGESDVVKGHLDVDAVFYATTTQHWILRVYSMNRRKKQENPQGYYADKRNRRTGDVFKKGEYLPRSYRLVGIDLASVMVGAGRNGKIRLFPDPPPPAAEFDGLWNPIRQH